MNDQTINLDLDLDEIEQRADAATKEPWGFYDGDNYADVAADLTMTGRGSYSYREKIARLEDETYWDDSAHEHDDEDRAPEQMVANAAFIAHARTDVPALLAEVRRLRAKLATGQALAADATEYRTPVPEDGGTTLLVRRQALAHGVGWAVSTMARGGGRAWTTEGWQEVISALSVDRLFCWPDAATARDEARRALAAATS